jgi:hypothetical protein
MAPSAPDPDTRDLLDRSTGGDASACQGLLTRHRARLRCMVAVRLERRLTYLRDRPLPFHAWLRQFTWEGVRKGLSGLRAGRRTGGLRAGDPAGLLPRWRGEARDERR